MTNTDQDDYYKTTLNIVRKFVESNQRKRINLLNVIESEVENLFSIGTNLFDSFDQNGDDWAAGWLLQVLKKHKPIFFQKILIPELQLYFFLLFYKSFQLLISLHYQIVEC